MTTEYIRYVFVTLTYARGLPETQIWRRVARDWNRYIQRIRRLHNMPVGYLRTIEAHEDLYPHLHAILDFGDAKIRVTNSKFFDKSLYHSWKFQWTSGVSDYQRPYPNSKHSPLLYIIKYISKDSTKKTIWRKYYADAKPRDAQSISELTTKTKQTVLPASNTDVKQSVPTTTLTNPSSFFCQQFKIKQCTWSRNFVFPRYRPQPLLVAQSLLTVQSK